jgi:hypothetical protein
VPRVLHGYPDLSIRFANTVASSAHDVELALIRNVARSFTIDDIANNAARLK